MPIKKRKFGGEGPLSTTAPAAGPAAATATAAPEEVSIKGDLNKIEKLIIRIRYSNVALFLWEHKLYLILVVIWFLVLFFGGPKEEEEAVKEEEVTCEEFVCGDDKVLKDNYEDCPDDGCNIDTCCIDADSGGEDPEVTCATFECEDGKVPNGSPAVCPDNECNTDICCVDTCATSDIDCVDINQIAGWSTITCNDLNGSDCNIGTCCVPDG